MTAGPILEVVVAVPSLDEAVAAYRSLLDLQVLASGPTWAVVGPTGATWGTIRFEEADDIDRLAPLRTLGWNALEVLVRDLDATYARCLGVDGFEVLQEPVNVGAEGRLRAFQVAGPAGEAVYLTQILQPSTVFDLPTLEEGENRVYVAVAGVRSADAVLAGLELRLGVRKVTDHGLPVRVLNKAYGLPETTLHRVTTVQLAGRCVIEVDEYPAAAVSRGSRAAGIRSVRMVSPAPRQGSVTIGELDIECVAVEE